MCKIEYDTSSEVMLTRLNKLEENLRSGNIKVTAVPKEVEDINNNKVNTTIKNTSLKEERITEESINVNSNSRVTINEVKKSWKDILERFKARREMIISSLIMIGRPVDCSNGIVTVQFDEQNEFAKNRLSDSKNKNIINEVFSEILQDNIKVNFTVDSNDNKERSAEDILRDTLGDDLIDFIDE